VLIASQLDTGFYFRSIIGHVAAPLTFLIVISHFLFALGLDIDYLRIYRVSGRTGHLSERTRQLQWMLYKAQSWQLAIYFLFQTLPAVWDLPITAGLVEGLMEWSAHIHAGLRLFPHPVRLLLHHLLHPTLSRVHCEIADVRSGHLWNRRECTE